MDKWIYIDIQCGFIIVVHKFQNHIMLHTVSLDVVGFREKIVLILLHI